MRTSMMSVLLTCSLFACGKGNEDKASGGAAPPASGAPASGAPAAAPPAPPRAPKASLDVCGFATKEQVEAAIGKLVDEPKPTAGQGKSLAGCEYMTETGMAEVSLHPVKEWDTNIVVSENVTEVPNLGEKTLSSKETGLYVKVGGKRYFFHVVVTSANGLDNDKALALAKAVVPNAK